MFETQPPRPLLSGLLKTRVLSLAMHGVPWQNSQRQRAPPGLTCPGSQTSPAQTNQPSGHLLTTSLT